MKNFLSATLKIGVPISLLLAGIMLLLNIFRSSFLSPPTILQEIPSPDGEYVAYVYECNGGATSGYVYHVSVLKAEKNLAKGNGNVYICDGGLSGGYDFIVDWISDRTLRITHYRSELIRKQKTWVSGVEIQYQHFGAGTR